jgi:hypothetical protein
MEVQTENDGNGTLRFRHSYRAFWAELDAVEL